MMASSNAPADAASQDATSGIPIVINGHVIDPEAQMPGGDLFVESASKTNYVVLQFTEYPNRQQEEKLNELRVQFLEVIPPRSWLVRYEPKDLSAIRDLPFVVFANPYHESLSLNPAWAGQLTDERPRGLVGSMGMSSSSTPPPERHEVIISLHPRSRSPGDFRDFLVSSHGIPRDGLFLEIGSLRASLTAAQIVRISKLDDVRAIELESRAEPCNHLMNNIIRGLPTPVAQTAYVQPGYQGLTGQGEIIAIADSGLDDGRTVKGPNDMKNTNIFFRNRILLLDPRSDGTGTSRQNVAVSRVGKVDDWTGHGTHVAGTALGSYCGLFPRPEMRVFGDRLDGVAPRASLVMQAVFGCPSWDAAGNYINTPVQLAQGNYAEARVFLDPFYGYPAGYAPSDVQSNPPVPTGTRAYPWRARIHSNSTATVPVPNTPGHGYNPGGAMRDAIVYNLPEYLLVYAAGNNGDDATALQFPGGQINHAASAKNVLTVGCCFNDQYIQTNNAQGGIRYESYRPPGPGPANGGVAVPPDNMPRFSSRSAPTAPPALAPGVAPPQNAVSANHSQIIKPDVVAPGVAIYSARSQAILDGVPANKYGVSPSDTNLFQFQTGTSMAAPVVAGAAALIREALRTRRGQATPSAALLKALIVNGAVDLSRTNPRGQISPGNTAAAAQDIDPAPSHEQGFGRLNIADSIDNVADTVLCGFEDARFGVNDRRLRQPAEQHLYAGTIASPPALATNPGAVANIKATLAWTDPPGEGLQNQLSLRIEFPDPGRNGLNIGVDVAQAAPGTALARMANNNVQKLEVRGITFAAAGQITANIYVRAERLIPAPGGGGGGAGYTAQAYAICWKVWYS